MAMEELADWEAARRASAGRLLPQIAAVDLSATALRLEVPFVLIQGSDDLNTPTEVAKAYFEQVDAPSKKFVVIDGAGHFAHLTHAPQFLSALREHSNSAFRTR
jgi:pimeloyl-ACP methyl ester carboxylesterase